MEFCLKQLLPVILCHPEPHGLITRYSVNICPFELDIMNNSVIYFSGKE